MTPASEFDTEALLEFWRWRVPPSATPLFITVFGDWVFGEPDGSIWSLSILEADYRQIARSSSEYNRLKSSFDWMEENFIAGWQEIAQRHGLTPGLGQCLGWRIHPILGGKFQPDNLQLFSMAVYQSLMGQLHASLRPRK